MTDLAEYSKELGICGGSVLTIDQLILSHRYLRNQAQDSHKTRAEIVKEVHSFYESTYKNMISLQELEEMSLNEILELLEKK